MKKLALVEVLEGIEDTRRKHSVMYPLHEVLIIMLLAVNSQSKFHSWRMVEIRMRNKRNLI